MTPRGLEKAIEMLKRLNCQERYNRGRNAKLPEGALLERIISRGNKTHQEIFALSARAAVTNHIARVAQAAEVPTVLKAGNPKIKVLAKSVPGEGWLLALQTAVVFIPTQQLGGGIGGGHREDTTAI